MKIANQFTLFPLKLKGASSHSTNARKLKGEEKMPRMNKKPANLQSNKSARKLKGREI